MRKKKYYGVISYEYKKNKKGKILIFLNVFAGGLTKTVGYVRILTRNLKMEANLMKKTILARGLLLAVSATLLGSLTACQRGDRPVISLTEAPIKNTAPVIAVTEPETVPDETLGQTVQETLIVRYTGEDAPFMKLLEDNTSEFKNIGLTVFSSAKELEDALGVLNFPALQEKTAAYDDAFWSEHDLLVIFRRTNTGSVRQSVELNAENKDTLTVTLRSETPEIATMDMANWVLLVPAPKLETQNLEINLELLSKIGDEDWQRTPEPGGGELITPGFPTVME